MTSRATKDFEKQVAQALEKLLASDCDGVNNPTAYELAPMLAPWVAAAIEAGLRQHWRDDLGDDDPSAHPVYQAELQTALSALRGYVPPAAAEPLP